MGGGSRAKTIAAAARRINIRHHLVRLLLLSLLLAMLVVVTSSAAAGGEKRSKKQQRSRISSGGVGGVDYSASLQQQQSAAAVRDTDTAVKGGLFPSVFNLATNADITANATCGQHNEPEIYCKLVEHVYVRAPQCGVCDDKDEEHRHPISNAIDGTNSRWQSPTLQNGRRYEWVTITIDLKQVYQVAYVVLKAANSPRPGNWILERSIDGQIFKPWQYYAISDAECLHRYGLEPREGKPTYRSDNEVICTSYYSKLDPLEDGEVHTSLINGRPGGMQQQLPSAQLLEFTLARYVRLRLQKMRTLNADLMSQLSSAAAAAAAANQGAAIYHNSSNSNSNDRSLFRRLFYSFKDISIGGQCVCNGHASSCPFQPEAGRAQCRCEHNTCGPSCDRCCPLFNQRPWRAGTHNDAGQCEQCQCFGHSRQCRYDPLVDRLSTSLNINNVYGHGGGVCINCTGQTTGVNCERCLDGHYRPATADRESPCISCQCHKSGSTSVTACNATTGLCDCRPGFAGQRCDRCAPGYHSFPNCEPCACDTAGIVDSSKCSVPCQCKANVEGEQCDRCKSGFYDLRDDNPEGCTRCFCFDRSGRCIAAEGLGIVTINDKLGWLVTDLLGRRVVTPSVLDADELAATTAGLSGDSRSSLLSSSSNGSSSLSIANDDMGDFESYYWLAPSDYLAKKLTAYNQRVSFRVSWVKARGDTGGRATRGPDIILEGAGMKMGYGDRTYHRENNATISWTLRENRHWYHIPDTLTDIVRRRRTERKYKGESVTRAQFLAVLNNLQRLMVRAKFHTDQIEGILHEAEMELGSESASMGAERARGIEQCECPPGYAGLSCEECAFGYVRRQQPKSLTTSGGQQQLGECVACQCHGHAATCLATDLTACSPCLHNTTGAQCQQCSVGFYGDARTGAVDACRKCYCPLAVESNNFSPTCHSAAPDNNNGYVCDRCPVGHEGQHCERCAEGFYGNPLVPGSRCRPCDCNKNHDVGALGWCDRLTGRCLKCRSDTTGDKCQLCQVGYYGNALDASCQECRCHPSGSASAQCDVDSGQCQCRERFTGKHCDRCKDGYGKIESGCVDCGCDLVGSVMATTCDVQTGQCRCKSGVGGLRCDQCLDAHYAFSTNGCRGCNCHQLGAKERSCNIVTGQCQCRPNVDGLKCHQCSADYWNLNSGIGCQACNCDASGSMRVNGTSCDANNGACYCLPGVGGRQCDQCLPGYYAFGSPHGCKKCEPCDKPGHVCDPDTGRCVCPPLTQGARCESCAPNAWNYEPIKGCRPCSCHSQGSRTAQCDAATGICSCRPGYGGQQCDRCASNLYFGFPHCQPCECNAAGSESQQCGHSASDGQCPCKPHATGRRCDTCLPSTFGLLSVLPSSSSEQQLESSSISSSSSSSASSSAGCVPCFCFGRSNTCSQAQLIWAQMRTEGSRGLMITYDPPNDDDDDKEGSGSLPSASANQFPVNTQEICYINLALPGDGQLHYRTGETQLNVTNNLRIVPDVRGDVMIGVSQFFDTPLYWQLPSKFLGDRTSSYNGLLRFTVTNHGGSALFPDKILATYPLVQLQGHRKLILEHYYHPTAATATTASSGQQQATPNGRYSVRLHESQWRVKNNPRGQVTRAMMMIALQNVQHILIRATDSMDRTKAELKEVSLQVASSPPPAPSNGTTTRYSLAHGVEWCQCPSEYASASCQDPARGFYRRYKHDYLTSSVWIDWVGEAARCQCSGRSEACDRETGRCIGCRENTAGDRCQLCAAGFYGDPSQPGGCKPCSCPTQERNFAESCRVVVSQQQQQWSCSCQRGYSGERCQRCDYGYYGQPTQGIPCQPCHCNVNGSVSDECHELTGQCNCKQGITGRDCTYCAPRHVISPDGCTSCQDDACTGSLFVQVDRLSSTIAHLDMSDFVPLPWPALFHQENSSVLFEHTLIERRHEYVTVDRLISAPNILPLAQITLQRAKESEVHSNEFRSEIGHLLPICLQSVDAVGQVKTILEDIIAYLKNYAIGETPSVNINKAVAEAESHWQYIQSIDVSSRRANAQRELDRSRKLIGSVRNLFDDGADTANIRDHLEGFKIRLDDLESHVQLSRNNTEMAYHSLAVSNATLALLRHSVTDITTKSNRIDDHLNGARKMNTNSSLSLTRARVAFQGLRTSLDNIKVRSQQCAAKEAELSRLNPEYRRKYVHAAQVHANHLWQQAQALFNQFNATRDVADLPLQAANAYRSIVDALKQARQAAEAAGEAAETAYTRAYPDDVDLSLLEQAKMSSEHSDQLLVQAKKLVVTVANHRDRLKGERTALDAVDVKLSKAVSSNAETNVNMDKLTHVRDRAKSAVEKSTEALSASNVESRRVADITSRIESELRVQLLGLQNNNRNMASFGNVPKLIEDTRKHVKHIDTKMNHLTKKSFEFRSINTTVALKLDELRRKILRAKQAASGIRVSLTGKAGSCYRTYTPPLQPSSVSSLTLTYAFTEKDLIGANTGDSLLVYLAGQINSDQPNGADFLALEMVGRQVRFLWNAGGGTTVLTHPLKLQPSPDGLTDDSRWYKIEAERTGNVGSLKVRPVKAPDDEDSLSNSAAAAAMEGTTVTGAGPPRFTKMDLVTGNKLYIGRLPDNPPSDLKTTKFSGHMHQLWLDGQPVGLWNFMTSSSGCNPSIEGAEEARDESSFRFNGQGYAELAQIPRYDSRQYSVTFNFRSLDEDALLFLAVNDTAGQFISLELSGGRLRYQVRYGAGDLTNLQISLESRQKYNTGQWVKVEASRVLLRGVETALLKVADDEELSAAPFSFGVPDLELEEARLYVGGLPPTVTIPPSLMSSVPGSFLGCISDLQVVAYGMNPLQGSYYGVEASCSGINKLAAFSGAEGSFIQLKAPTTSNSRRDLSLALGFKTSASDGSILMLMTPSALPTAAAAAALAGNSNALEQKDEQKEKDADMMSLTILPGGQLEARFRSSPTEVVSITSSDSFNDGLFHNVVVVRTGRKVELLVDDNSIGTVRLARQQQVPPSASSSGDSLSTAHLYLGGIRPEWFSAAADFIGVQHSFTGCITDLSFNNQLVDLSYPVRHSGASVGRCQHVPQARPSSLIDIERMQANEKALSSCRDVPQYTIEGRAFKFGDAPYSHVAIVAPMNRKELQSSNFNFTLDFRTHYPNGVLLFSAMKQQKMKKSTATAISVSSVNHLLVALRNGRVVVSLQSQGVADGANGRKHVEDLASASANVNDGQWHRVHIVKDKRKVTLVLDDGPALKAKGPNRLQLDGQLFVGGLSEQAQQQPDGSSGDGSGVQVLQLEGFKGCIRNVNLNGRPHDLASAKNMIHRVGQCFAHVETGSYFPGDAFAVYADDFRVASMADVQLEFRTTQLNGVLLSVAQRKGSPSLSLSINDGTVVFAVDMGDNRTFSVGQSFPSPFQLCDNRWHSVKASYVENALTLKVDSLDEQYGFYSTDDRSTHKPTVSGQQQHSKVRTPLYIGGLPESEPQGAMRVRDNFKGCIRNVVIRGEIKDWTDMARLNNVLLNSCPIH